MLVLLVASRSSDLEVDKQGGNGKIEGLPQTGSGGSRVPDGVCPFLENSTVC